MREIKVRPAGKRAISRFRRVRPMRGSVERVAQWRRTRRVRIWTVMPQLWPVLVPIVMFLSVQPFDYPYCVCTLAETPLVFARHAQSSFELGAVMMRVTPDELCIDYTCVEPERALRNSIRNSAILWPHTAPQHRVVVNAAPNVRWGAVRRGLEMVAEHGFDEIDFLVRTEGFRLR